MQNTYIDRACEMALRRPHEARAWAYAAYAFARLVGDAKTENAAFQLMFAMDHYPRSKP